MPSIAGGIWPAQRLPHALTYLDEEKGESNMSGCPSDRSVHVPVGTLSLTLTGLAVAGIAVLATQVTGVPGGDAPPSGVIIASTAAIERGNSSGGIAAAGPMFTSGFEDTAGAGCRPGSTKRSSR